MTSASGPWGTGTFVYDAVDNLRTTTVGSRSTVASYVGNRLTSLSTNNVPSSYTYDLNGNLTAKGPQGFTFDLGNRMSTANGKATYAYDGLGRRTWVAYAGGRNKLQIYSQAGQLLYAYDTVEGVSDYVYLDGQLIAESNHLSGTAYTHTDLLGSPIARTNASGQLLSRTTFEPYGATANGTPPTDIGFTGHVHDADTALVYMQQRYYDPIAGRFLSVDPVTTSAKDGSSFNRYAYANDSPYKYTDPDGQFGLAGAIAGAAFEAFAQYAVTGTISDGKAIVVAAAVGAITGGIGGAAAKAALMGTISSGTAVAATATGSSAAAVAGKFAEGALKGTAPSSTEVAIAAAGGAIGGAAGAKVANGAAAALERAAVSKDGVVAGIAETTMGAIRQSGPAQVTTTVGSAAAQKAIDAGASLGQKIVEEKAK
jgi:RHS repeat-associated protein